MRHEKLIIKIRKYKLFLRKRVIFNTSTTLPIVFFNRYIFSKKFSANFVNFYTRAKASYKLGSFFFSRKFYYFPQKPRKSKR